MVRRQLQRWLPSPDKLRAQRSLRWLGPLLRRPWLWQLSRRRVAAGAAIGVFFGLLVPLLQIAFSALFAVLLRANLPVAAVATLVSNPLTYAPIMVAAYHVGASLLGTPVDAVESAALADAAGGEVVADPEAWQKRLARIGKPLAVGLGLFALAGAALAWVAVHVVWIAAVAWRRRARSDATR